MIIKPFIVMFTVMSINQQSIEPWTLDSFPNTFTKDGCIKELTTVKQYLHDHNGGILNIECVLYERLDHE
jgi:hypothetical protein